MSVTITRRQVIELGEKAIDRATSRMDISMAPPLDRDPEVAAEAPEVLAFRQVIATGTAFAVGLFRRTYGIDRTPCDCPMGQTVFGFPGTSVTDDISADTMSVRLAFAWDDVVEGQGGAWENVGVVLVNPHTEA